MNKYRYKLSYTQWYWIDLFNTDSYDYDQSFDTLQEALDEYEKLKAKNTSEDWPRDDFKLIEYREIPLDEFR